MARIQLNLPDYFHFATNLEVRIDDINYGGHMGNQAVLVLAHEARLRFLKHHGYTELDIEGAGTIMTDAAIVYRAEAFQGDVLTVEVAVGDFHKYGCDFFFKMTNKASGKEVARAKTGIFFFDYGNKRKLRPPAAFKKRFDAHAQKADPALRGSADP